MSQLITNTVQLGQDQTNTANNFVLSVSGDGSFSISAGVPGNTASPVFEVTTAGAVLVNNVAPVSAAESSASATSTAILYSIVLGG